ncbi:hypothetical protein TsFJ059_009546 [Trichoderma semiorbis]|uniref:protein-ribulosamine 3-kinase n=1 Tax=Trichoderma semiorbis TaxID=1491008 RepID=A0A9P8KP76_9HYPO|nr:hypothetical protein TsFJ059_009546 [Trichoderma semiorbis]
MSLEVILTQLPQPLTELQFEHTYEASPKDAHAPSLEHADKVPVHNGHQRPPEHKNEAPPMTIKQILAQLSGVFPTDEAVVEALPAGSTFVSIKHFGTSAWTITGRLITLDQDGSEKIYFLKVAYGETGPVMLNGEFESSKTIYSTMSNFIPEPFGFGKYKIQSPPTYFYLSEFIEMDVTTAPDPGDFCHKLATLHKLSKSPTGKFGFHTKTCDGDRAQVVNWQDSWAVFYRNLFLGVCELDIKPNGEYQRAIQQVA